MTGVLAGIEDEAGADLRDVEAFVGTSAGAIVAARLAAGRRRCAGRRDARRRTDGDGRGRRRDRGLAAQRGPLGLGGHVAAGAGGDRARRARRGARALGDAGPRARHRAHRSAACTTSVERSGARFDGRLRVCCVDQRSGRRVGLRGAGRAARQRRRRGDGASCAIPWVFAPVRIGEREYVDGGVWSVTNLDAAPAGRLTEVLCLDPTASLRSPLRQAFRVAISVELQILRRRGTRVRHIGPDDEAAAAMGTDFMATGPSAAALAAGHRQGRALAAG